MDDKPLNNFGLLDSRPHQSTRSKANLDSQLDPEDISDFHYELALKLETNSQEIDYE